MSEMFELMNNFPQTPVIKVVGVGGGGCNAVKYMVASEIEGVEFVYANTDVQALDLEESSRSEKTVVLQLGSTLTKGLGAGANPEIGREAALEDIERIRDVLVGTDMVFITAGMGGGTGTGGAPVVAQVARELGILTVAIVTRPFPFEGRKRMLIAEEGIRMLRQSVDSLITIPNEKLLSVLGKSVTLLNAFKAANDVLKGAVQGIAELITRPGLINVDFADVRTVMSEMGLAMMGTGVSSGENRAREAADAAIFSPLLDDVDLAGAKGVLVNVTAGMDLSISEFEEVGNAIRPFTSDEATVIIGTVIDHTMGDQLRVTLVATGLGTHESARQEEFGYQKREEAKLDRDYRYGSTRLVDRGVPVSQRRGNPVHSSHNQSKSNTAAGYRTRETSVSDDLDYLDIPAFLRRQVDQVD